MYSFLNSLNIMCPSENAKDKNNKSVSHTHTHNSVSNLSSLQNENSEHKWRYFEECRWPELMDPI